MTQIRNPKQDSQDAAENRHRPVIGLGFGTWDLGFDSDFGFRVSDFFSGLSAA
jgi:hypothetical protein